jgi:peptidoglycan/xylan/chitin deacetylase (PgdA/CDA1 family)
MDLLKILPIITGQKLILPFYHAVCNDEPIHLKHLYKVRSSETFEKDLDYLLQYYTAVSIDEISDHANHVKSLKKNSFFISFDDGLSEFKELAWPILKRKGIPTALYVNPKFVDNKELFYRFKASILIDFIQNNENSKLLIEANELLGSLIDSVSSLETFVRGIKYEQKQFLDDLAEYFKIDFNVYLMHNKPYLNTDELKELKSEGLHIGAHSMDHPLFYELNEKDMKWQLEESVKWVNQTFNQEISSFSYPFTDFGLSGKFFEQVFNNNNPKVDLTFGTAGMKKEQLKKHLQRIPIEDYSTDMRNIIKQQYLYYLAKTPLLKNTIRR